MRPFRRTFAALVLFAITNAIGVAQDPVATPPMPTHPALVWLDDYATGWRIAEEEERMLLIRFVDARRTSSYQKDLDEYLESHPTVEANLRDFVLLRLPLDASIEVQGRSTRILDHAAFDEMNRNEGLAIIDLKHDGEDYFQHVVSAFPFTRGKYYQFDPVYMPVILGLPQGTITQRTMVWAVRIHPEHPSSTTGELDPQLMREASLQSNYQAQIQVQGHHRWENRFHRIRGLLGGIFSPVEVVAESWPNQNLLDSCIDCVASWRQSSGHWNAVKQPQERYGYDIKRGRNGIWYGTGIFASLRSN